MSSPWNPPSRFRALLKRTLGWPVQRAAQWYISQDRIYRYGALRVHVPVGVFHPGLFGSTRFMLRHLDRNPPPPHGRVLEIGAGSGLISLVLASHGHPVTATDISRRAVATIERNLQENGIDNVTVIRSDLFEALPTEPYSLVVVTPPYYPADPETEADHAWYCGSELQYFRRLFRGLEDYTSAETTILMVLSAACPIDAIDAIARMNGWCLVEADREPMLFEYRQYILHIERLAHEA